MTSLYEVIPYDFDVLLNTFIANSEIHESKLKNKVHTLYFKEYFQELHAKTILIEKKYIDHDYLNDFSEYYVKCFYNYNRFCSRLHFFTNEFSDKDFENLLNSDFLEFKEVLQLNYLGFIVVKPLPETIIGRTCLKTYDSISRRQYPIIREYEVNLFGINLTINSLAYQEQDSVVAACATSALWSAFNGTGKIFQHSIPSPSEITKNATTHSPIQSRIFPNEGLTLELMSNAIRNINLEPYLIGITEFDHFRSSVYAYLKASIPIILGFNIVDITDTSDIKFVGKHAVAITGYSIDNSVSNKYDKTNLLLKSLSVNKIYVHDDQVGPFARMNFDNLPIVTKKGTFSSLSTSWLNNDKNVGFIRAIPDMMLIPLYNKIRIPFNRILYAIVVFDSFIDELMSKGFLNLPSKIVWDTFLEKSNIVKTNLLTATDIEAKVKKNLLVNNLPKYIWRATAYIGSTRIFDLIFDATDIEQGNVFLYTIEYDKTISSVLRAFANNKSVRDKFSSTPAKPIFEWLNR